jgi:transcriptional regulator with XRE-family HTH domain
LRLARRARGFSQQQVAGRAGISRQAISAIESGVSDPSLRVAFALAEALDTTVGELFGTSNLAAPVAAAPVGPPGGAGARVTLAPMGTGYVALPLREAAAAPAGFLPAGGLTARTGPGQRRAGRMARPIGPAHPGRGRL